MNYLFNVQGTLLTEVRGARTTSVVAWCRCSLLGWRKALWNFNLYPLTRALLAYWRGLYDEGGKSGLPYVFIRQGQRKR